MIEPYSILSYNSDKSNNKFIKDDVDLFYLLDVYRDLLSHYSIEMTKDIETGIVSMSPDISKMNKVVLSIIESKPISTRRHHKSNKPCVQHPH